ncbi:MAG: diguanylate cyclase [archaeon]
MKIEDSAIIIKLSAGIGRNLREAEETLKIAKTKKYRKTYNIELYSGPRLKSTVKNLPKEVINSYKRLEIELSKSKSAISDLEVLKRDPKTGLLNKTGYLIEKEKLKSHNKYNSRFVILFDCDSMHRLNQRYGYCFVDKYLTLIGNTLNNCTRKDNHRKEKDIIITQDPLMHRKNDSAGDEFIIDISCKEKDIKNVAKRYLAEIYNAQKKLALKKKS